MTLGFSTNFPDGTPTLFPEKIILPYRYELRQQYPNLLPKIHTFRLGARWRAGMKMHMVTGNRTPNRAQFGQQIPELQNCTSVQDAMLYILPTGINIAVGTPEIDQRLLTRQERLLFAVNDGFNSIDEMERWFFPKGYNPIATPIVGQIIHFTKFRY